MKPKADVVVHEVDGIEEYDNKLPNWWLAVLFGSIAVAAVYWFVYQTSGFGDLPLAEYHAEMDRAAATEAVRIKAAGVMTPETLLALSKDKGTVRQGREIFVTTCVACHRADGGGIVGPNLTDDFWIHGGGPDNVLATIMHGVAEKGMPAWGPQLGAERVQAVTAYVITLRGSHVEAGKAPQGTMDIVTLK